MGLSDSPYAVGTPEHSDWVKNTFIPAVSSERTKADRAAYGAESIGGTYIDGWTHNPDGTPRSEGWLLRPLSIGFVGDVEEEFALCMPRQQGRTITGTFQITDPEAWKALTGGASGMSAAFQGLSSSLVIIDDPIKPAPTGKKPRAQRRARAKKPTRPRRGPVKATSARLCPQHGRPAESCKFCRR